MGTVARRPALPSRQPSGSSWNRPRRKESKAQRGSGTPHDAPRIKGCMEGAEQTRRLGGRRGDSHRRGLLLSPTHYLRYRGTILATTGLRLITGSTPRPMEPGKTNWKDYH